MLPLLYRFDVGIDHPRVLFGRARADEIDAGVHFVASDVLFWLNWVE
jgi:hypothetical protein